MVTNLGAANRIMQYHHTGVVTDQQQPDEVYVEATKVWVTKPEDHPYRIEYPAV